MVVKISFFKIYILIPQSNKKFIYGYKNTHTLILYNNNNICIT